VHDRRVAPERWRWEIATTDVADLLRAGARPAHQRRATGRVLEDPQGNRFDVVSG